MTWNQESGETAEGTRLMGDEGDLEGDGLLPLLLRFGRSIGNLAST
jgi:hypothetical protein